MHPVSEKGHYINLFNNLFYVTVPIGTNRHSIHNGFNVFHQSRLAWVVTFCDVVFAISLCVVCGQMCVFLDYSVVGLFS